MFRSIARTIVLGMAALVAMVPALRGEGRIVQIAFAGGSRGQLEACG